MWMLWRILYAQKIDDKYLIELFDVTPTTLEHWKNGTRKISIDKKVILANLFGITMNQFINREENDGFQLDDFYGLTRYGKIDNYKELSTNDLRWLFEKIVETECSIEYFPIGYIPLQHDDSDPVVADEDFYRHYIGYDEVEYSLQTLKINVTYEFKDGTKKTIKNISFNELKEMSKKMRSNWSDEAPNHIHANSDDVYYDVLMINLQK